MRSPEVQSRMAVAVGWGQGGVGSLYLMGTELPVSQDARSSGDGWWWWSYNMSSVYFMLLNCALKNGLRWLLLCYINFITIFKNWKEKVSTRSLRLLSLESWQDGPWLPSGNLNFRRVPAFPNGESGSLCPHCLYSQAVHAVHLLAPFRLEGGGVWNFGVYNFVIYSIYIIWSFADVSGLYPQVCLLEPLKFPDL